MDAINLVNGKETPVFGNDSVAIQKFNGGFKGGRVLNVKDFTETHIYAGHPIYRDEDGSYKPVPMSEGKYTAPAKGEIVGVLYRTIATAKPSASIMFDGEVNAKVYDQYTDEMEAAVKAACPNIVFVYDEPFVEEEVVAEP